VATLSLIDFSYHAEACLKASIKLAVVGMCQKEFSAQMTSSEWNESKFLN